MKKFLMSVGALLSVVGLAYLLAPERTGAGTVLLTADALSAGGADAAGGEDAAKKGSAYKLVVPLDIFMEGTEEAFDEIEKQIEGKKFKLARKRALFVAECLNVVSHADYETVKTDEQRSQWTKLASTVRDELLKLGEAANAKEPNAAELMKMFTKTKDQSCETCHEKFRDV